ncbi:carboxymuconolactone decarboxylase family protein [Sphingobium amiense]|uniref:Carboxymuconolactone decarboxylase family protein n=1 Tax=Sphingobium amiense TaxID=135719 RepID=A0A494W128_9SPHN|nr:hypothetical protein [Sphingobium amiense]BBD97026.1 carboxymuconolactone decarboxylase family protein [Sphingobium amiense]
MRLPLLNPAELNQVQRELYDDMRAGIATGFNTFRTALDDGTLIGPWNASLHHTGVGRAFWDLTKAMNAMGVLPIEVKEVAILVVGGHYNAAYEIYAHVAAANHIGIPLDRIAGLVAGVKPDELSAQQSVAFDVAHALCQRGPLAEPLWRLAVATFGDGGAAQLVYLVGLYAFVATTLNGFDVPAPDYDDR